MKKPVLKGFDKFREKTTPRFAGKKIALVPVIFISSFILGLIVIILFDNYLPDILANSGMNAVLIGLFPILGVCIVGITGFILTYQMWFWRERLKAKYSSLAYQRIVPVGFCGIVLVISLAFVNFSQIQGAFWTVAPFNFLVAPYESNLGTSASFIFWPRVILGIGIAIIGLGMSLRSILTFGFDYTTVVYLYFPEESKIQTNAIYSALRHPMYSGMLTVALGGMIFRFTPYAIVFYLIYLLGFIIHVRFVEERELIGRFGNSYKDYQKKVPAFFVRPSKLKTLIGFVFRSPEKNA